MLAAPADRLSLVALLRFFPLPLLQPILNLIGTQVARGTGLDFAPGDVDGAPRIVQVAVHAVHVAYDELDEAAARRLQRLADVRGPGIFVQGLFHAQEVRVRLAREHNARAAQRIAHDRIGRGNDDLGSAQTRRGADLLQDTHARHIGQMQIKHHQGGRGGGQPALAQGGLPEPAQLEEALIIIKTMWTQTQATFEGKHYQVTGAYCEPKPDPIPQIMIGAFRPKMLRLAAKFADGWNVSSTGIQRYRRLVEEFERLCAGVGRDPSTVRRSWCGGCICAPTQDEVKRIAGDHYNAQDLEDDFDFIGTPDQLVEQMRPFIELGVDYFMLDCGGFPELTTLELLVSQVLPALNGS